jgi:site-specific recombinase XerD
MEIWRASGRSESTIAVYVLWVRKYRAHCRARRLDEVERLTRADVVRYARSYRGARRGRHVKKTTRIGASNALHAWSCALKLFGKQVPVWCPAPVPRRLSPLLTMYAQYRQAHRGVAPATLARDMDVTSGFVRSLREHGRTLAATRAIDVDRFIDTLSARRSRRTVAGLCSSLRCFFRFLQVSGRVRRDLASYVVAPRYRTDEHPPRALPWFSVRRILRVIPRDSARGPRDFAMLLLMATYGLGASEVVGLCLDDIDWRANVLRARRPKTEVPLELPLLPAVAQAIADYIRRGRPPHIETRALFVGFGLPHNRVSTSAIRAKVRKYARAAGIKDAVGAHVFRHSHATEQIDAGANPKVVSDILGHRRPSSTSVYVRVALQRLRTVALPVPR